MTVSLPSLTVQVERGYTVQTAPETAPETETPAECYRKREGTNDRAH